MAPRYNLSLSYYAQLLKIYFGYMSLIYILSILAALPRMNFLIYTCSNHQGV